MTATTFDHATTAVIEGIGPQEIGVDLCADIAEQMALNALGEDTLRDDYDLPTSEAEVRRRADADATLVQQRESAISRLEEFRQTVMAAMFAASDRRALVDDSEVLDGVLRAIDLALTVCARKSAPVVRA